MLKNSILLIVLLFVLLFGCKSTETITIGRVSNVTDAKLRNLLKENEFNYNKLYLKKVQFSYDDQKEKRNFKGSFVVQKDSQIVVSITALMGIELIRARLTKDEVIIVDRHNKVALKSDYNYFKERYGVELDYDIIQSIITNSLFIYPSERDHYDALKKYKHHLGENHYSFKSLKDKRLGRLNRRSRNNIIIHELKIYPDIYRIFNNFIKDFDSNQSINIDYLDFKNFGKILFPEKIKLKAGQGEKYFSINLKINYLEVDNGGSLHFKIPSSYKIKTL